MKFRQPHDEKANELERARCRVDCGTESKVQQSHAKDADLNEIVRRCGITERMPVVPSDPRFYGDVGEVPDLGTALRIVNEAKERFDTLPVAIRNRFRNSPAELWDFVQDENNYDEALKLGILKKPEPPVSQAAPVVDGVVA